MTMGFPNERRDTSATLCVWYVCMALFAVFVDSYLKQSSRITLWWLHMSALSRQMLRIADDVCRMRSVAALVAPLGSILSSSLRRAFVCRACRRSWRLRQQRRRRHNDRVRCVWRRDEAQQVLSVSAVQCHVVRDLRCVCARRAAQLSVV